MRFGIALGLACAAVATSAGACAGGAHQSTEPRASGGRPQPVTDNVLRADYAGSHSCKRCHAGIYKEWLSSPMHHMTRNADALPLGAPFDRGRFEFKGDSTTMESRGGRRYMRVVSKYEGNRLYRITRLIGGRYRFDFAGVQVASTAADAPPLSAERIMPASYLLFNHRWRYKGYSVMVPERPGLKRGPRWARTCIFCHNTEPYFSVTLDEMFGPGSPGYQGSASIALPRSRRFRFEVTDAAALRRAVDAELAYLGAPPAKPADNVKELLAVLIHRTRFRFDGSRLVEVGIGCEDCHGGARQHVRDPRRFVPTFAVRSDFMRVLTPQGAPPNRAQNINRTCERCHTVLFSEYPYTWEGGLLHHDPGGSSIVSGEARNFLLGGCSSEMSCATCHDPHTKDTKRTLDALAGPTGNRLCARCHTKLATAAAVRAHTHHPTGSAGSMCINCHMPKKVMGLAYALTRYHRIGSPTDRARVEGDRPLECALCHSDMSVAKIVTTMEKWWGKRYDRDALERLYGPNLGVNAIEATLMRGKAHEQAVAIAVAGEDDMVDALPLLRRQLENRYPLVRYYAKKAIAEIEAAAPGRDRSREPARTTAPSASAWSSAASLPRGR